MKRFLENKTDAYIFDFTDWEDIFFFVDNNFIDVKKYSHEAAYVFLKAVYDTGVDEGEKDGYDNGISDGWQDGFDQGKEEGRVDGYGEGFEDGENK